MNILVLNESPRKPGNTKRLIAAFSFKGDFPEFPGLDNLGVYTAHGAENSSEMMMKIINT